MLARLWLQRLSLPYNEQGRHFDAAQALRRGEGRGLAQPWTLARAWTWQATAATAAAIANEGMDNAATDESCDAPANAATNSDTSKMNAADAVAC